MPLLATDLVYEYASGTTLAHLAINDISLDIEPGMTEFIIGSTGSGKSTLLKLLAGLIEPLSGVVSLDGSEIHPGQVGIVFQHPEAQLFAETVLTDVAFGPKNAGKSDAEATELARTSLERVGLDPDEVGDRSPFSLSGGQARRAAIAGILAMNCPYLLLDEPTAGLDGRGRAFIHDLIADLNSTGCGVVVVSHDIDEFIGSCDGVMLLRDGHAVWQGCACELIAQPSLFSRAGLMAPELLAFQEQLACNEGGYSLDVDEVARWALSGYALGGPKGYISHVHDEGGDA